MRLTAVPRDLPQHTTELLVCIYLKETGVIRSFNRLLADNEIARLSADGLFGGLPHLRKVDLTRNRLTNLEPNTFEGCAKLTEL